MCAICGIYNLNRAPVNIDTLLKMRDIMYYRGPDDEGVIVPDKNMGLGHRRLSIIDLSDAAHLSKKSIRRGIIQPTAVEKALGNNMEFNRELWGLVCLETWFRVMVDN